MVLQKNVCQQIKMKRAEKHLTLVNKYIALDDISKAKDHHVRANELLGFGMRIPFLEFLKKRKMHEPSASKSRNAKKREKIYFRVKNRFFSFLLFSYLIF